MSGGYVDPKQLAEAAYNAFCGKGATKCRICGAPIMLLATNKSGKRLPVDPRPVDFVIGDTTHSRRFVTDDGEVFRGELAGDGELDHDRMIGWQCHFDTCRGERKR